uniref:Response regulator n=1 Tax=Roseihalotalea indica TaxID=2867963 RepID=A0AA49JFI2_9BACT|nr:response regulator [Tunicatimonas sp. TK19036]
MARVKILIVEDDLIAAEDIKELLEETNYVVTGVARTYDEAVDLFKETNPDLVVMDIQLEGQKDGIDVAAELTLINRVPIIYLTGNAEHKIRKRATRTPASTYILKPYRIEEFLTNIDLAIRNFAKSKIDAVTALSEAVFLPTDDNGHEKVMKQDIHYIEGDRGYVRIYTKNKMFHITTNLATLTPQLESPDFLRVSKKYVVNAYHLVKLNKDSVWIEGRQILIGDNYRKELYERLNVVRTKV